MEYNIKDARFRILNPERYIIETARYPHFFCENNRLIYRSINNNLEIDFTMNISYHYNDEEINIITVPIDNNKPIFFKENILKLIRNIRKEIRLEQNLLPFKKVLEIFTSFEEDIFIEADRNEKTLIFYNKKILNKNGPEGCIKLTSDGAINFVNKPRTISLYTRLQIKKMSEYLVEQILCTQEELMHEALK